MIRAVKLTLQTQLLPDREQSQKLSATMAAFNAAADWLAGEAFRLQTANKVKLQQLYYRELRERFGLSAQMAVRCIAQVCEAFSRDRSKRPHFRKYASMPYDQRLMSFKGARRVSLLTLEGRIIVPVVMGKYQSERCNGKHGQCDLVRRKDGKWFLLVTVDVPDRTPQPSTDFIGIDLGVENIATDSDGDRFSGANVERIRQKNHKQRQALQQAAAKRKAKGYRPQSIRRKLKNLSGKESRFRKNTNHVISKQLVEKATGTGRGIALEDLKGIRERTRFRKNQRAKMSGWSFHQLRAFIEYKAAIARVPVVAVDPVYTSQMCSQCGHRERANRKSQSEFLCRSCGFEAHADYNGALNVRARALVNAPMVSEKRPAKVAKYRDKLHLQRASV
jgi:IS605 OrfB family transposase